MGRVPVLAVVSLLVVAAACSIGEETQTDCQYGGGVWVEGDGCSAGHCATRPSYG